MKKALLAFQEAHNKQIAEPNEANAAALETTKSNLISAAVDCDATKLPDDVEVQG